ncbi:MAG: hypothetical protein WAX38_02080 [Minisyncoccia bacterium]
MKTAQKNVAVIRGGVSYEYDFSLKTGQVVLENLPKHFTPHDILIDKKGQWHRRGMPVTPEVALRGIDVAYVALHGKYGEDGLIQRTLNLLGVPFAGSNPFESMIAQDKGKTRDALKGLVPMPQYHVVVHEHGMHYADIARNIFAKFGPPYVVKSLRGGSSVHMRIVPNIQQLPRALSEIAAESGDDLIVEHYLRGPEATCTLVEYMRNEEHYVLPPAEVILPKGSQHFDFESKLNGRAQILCPGTFTHDIKNQLEKYTRVIHTKLGLTHFSQSDFILSHGKVYFLETDSLPSLHPHALLHAQLSAVGIPLAVYLEHVLSRAETTRRH